jgi:hypothetical protein
MASDHFFIESLIHFLIVSFEDNRLVQAWTLLTD